MFCPFIKGECREDCTFRHIPRVTLGKMAGQLSTCILAIAADELDQYFLNEDDRKDQNS